MLTSALEGKQRSVCTQKYLLAGGLSRKGEGEEKEKCTSKTRERGRMEAVNASYVVGFYLKREGRETTHG